MLTNFEKNFMNFQKIFKTNFKNENFPRVFNNKKNSKKTFFLALQYIGKGGKKIKKIFFVLYLGKIALKKKKNRKKRKNFLLKKLLISFEKMEKNEKFPLKSLLIF